MVAAAGVSYYFAKKGINERREQQAKEGTRPTEKLDCKHRAVPGSAANGLIRRFVLGRQKIEASSPQEAFGKTKDNAGATIRPNVVARENLTEGTPGTAENIWQMKWGEFGSHAVCQATQGSPDASAA